MKVKRRQMEILGAYAPVESGDMVCCDVCGGWFHFSCIGVRAGVSPLEGRTLCAFSAFQHVY